MKRIVAVISVLIMFLGLLSGCAKPGSSVNDTSQKPQSLKIGVLFIEDNLPLFLAEAEDRFKKEGLDAA